MEIQEIHLNKVYNFRWNTLLFILTIIQFSNSITKITIACLTSDYSNLVGMKSCICFCCANCVFPFLIIKMLAAPESFSHSLINLFHTESAHLQNI